MENSKKAIRHVADLPNLGPKSQAMLSMAGINSVAKLRKMGAVAAYHKIKQCGGKASLNLLWALEGAICNMPWQAIARTQRTRLLLALDMQEEYDKNKNHHGEPPNHSAS